MLAVGSRQPGRSSQCWLPTNLCVWIQVVLEKLFLQTRDQTQRIRSAQWKLPASALFSHWAALLPHLDPWDSEGHRFNGGFGEHQCYSYLHIMHIALGLRQKSQTLNTGQKKIKPWRRHSGCNRGKKWAQYLVWFRGAKAAAVQEVRIFRDNLINENSGTTLKPHWTA